ncbi:MAG: tetratricopeptide repeat protein [Gaiella sp.]
MARPDPEVLERRVEILRAILSRDENDEVSWFGLGRALLELDRAAEARDAFSQALRIKPDYTAAYRDLGRASLESGDAPAARETLERGIEVAERTGDLQTRREMEVFLKRARRRPGSR